MSYIAQFEKKYLKHKKNKYTDKKTALKMVFWNLKYIFNNISNKKTNNELIPSRVLYIAFRTNGGFGNVLIHANFIKQFREKFSNPNINITVFGHPIKEMTEAIFKEQNFVDSYYNYTDLKDSDFDYYDLVIDIHSYPDIRKANYSKIHAINPNLYNLLMIWKNFRNNDNVSRFFTLRPILNSQIYIYSILNEKNCLNVADIDNALGLAPDFTLELKCNKDEKQVLHTLKLQPQKFITVQRGVNPFSGTTEAPKMWPVEYYEKLIKLLKIKFPRIKIVQLGESSERCKPLKGVDINLLGKTDWDDLKILLKHALYHIDGECGMVHLRKALHAGPSIVLFGPTPIEFFGYIGNINLQAGPCKNCAALTDTWQKKCIRGDKVCMYSLTPEKVIKAINDYESHKNIKKKSLYEEITQNKDINFDKKWQETWLSKKTLFAYEIVNIRVCDLKIFVFENEKWIKKDLQNSPAVKYLNGNKEAYQNYCDYKNSYNPDDLHSCERFEKLIASFNKDNKIHIVVDKDNVIIDGRHRASIIYYKDMNAVIPVLKIYGDF